MVQTLHLGATGRHAIKLENRNILLYMRILGRIMNFVVTSWCRVLLEKLTGLQLVKKFPEFQGT